MTPQELKTLLVEVTQGDWVAGRYDPKRDEIVILATDDEYVASIDCDGAYDVKTGPTITANARLIAMAPALARLVIAAEKLAEALRWYSDECNYIDTPSWNGDPKVYTAKAIPVDTYDGAQYCDQGDRARAAIAEWEAAL